MDSIAESKYYISFDTRINPGKLEAITVSLGIEIITDMEKPLSINLCEHPLYKDLVEYVRHNPPRKL